MRNMIRKRKRYDYIEFADPEALRELRNPDAKADAEDEVRGHNAPGDLFDG